MMIPLSSPGRTCSGPVRVSYVLPLSRGCTESAGRRTGSFGRDTADAEGSGAAKAEPVRSSGREGSEALAADTAGTG